jgi:hypothetical protein
MTIATQKKCEFDTNLVDFDMIEKLDNGAAILLAP